MALPPNFALSLEMYVCNAFSAEGGGSPSQRTSTRRSLDTTSPWATASTASSRRWWPDDSDDPSEAHGAEYLAHNHNHDRTAQSRACTPAARGAHLNARTLGASPHQRRLRSMPCHIHRRHKQARPKLALSREPLRRRTWRRGRWRSAMSSYPTVAEGPAGARRCRRLRPTRERNANSTDRTTSAHQLPRRLSAPPA